MMPASTRGIGMALGFPDVCNTPAPSGTVPIPYPNVADHSTASGTVTNVRINMLDALNMMSQVPTSSGDEAGSAHATIKGAQRYTMGMPNIRLNMMPAITLASITSHNQGNCPIGAVLVPSAPNVRFNRATSNGRSAVGLLDEATARDHAEAACADGLTEAASGVLVVHHIPMAFAAELAQAVEASRSAGASVLRIDLRSCRGGVFDAAVDAAGLFLPPGTPIVRVIDEDGDESLERARGAAFLELPLELWIGPHTASAAEVFAGALAAAGRARLVGTATLGKGSLTELVALGDGRSCARPRGETLLPDGTPIQGRGVSPHAALGEAVSREPAPPETTPREATR